MPFCIKSSLSNSTWTKDAMAENLEFDSGELNSELRGPSIFAAVAVKMDATRAVVLLTAKLTIVWCHRMKKFLSQILL